MDDYFAWQQGRQGMRQGSRAHADSGKSPEPAPLPRTEIEVQEHHASTTVIRKIRLALFKNRRGE